MAKRSIGQILKAYKANGYVLDERPFAMNIFGIRANSTEPDSFNDIIGYLYKDGSGKWNVIQSAGTTDTGTYWLKNPQNPKGTAMLVAGQYKDAYGIGYHRGKYLAFKQMMPVNVLRDYDRDAFFDFANGKHDRGLFGINLHRAGESGTTEDIGLYSAGCQVWANADEFNNALAFGKRHKEKYGNKFTYTLFDERADFRRRLRFGSGIGVSLIAFYIAYKLIK
jgi:hypothetical protein